MAGRAEQGDLEAELDERIGPDTGIGGGDAPDPATVVEAALSDVESFWERTYEAVYGAPYEPISGGFFPYGPRTELPPCGRERLTYEDIAANAFYCPPDDLLAWDAVNLVPQLYEEFGGFTLGIVFAHELGHAVQARAGFLGSVDTILTELQADCFAGAWTADVAAGNSEFFEVTAASLDKAIAGFLSLRDGVGTSAQDPRAHGTGFDRIGAFTEGYEDGATFCADYPARYAAGELVIVEVPFTDIDDFERGGNLPLDELVPALLTDLDDFWTHVFEELGEAPWRPVGDVVPVDPRADEVDCGDATYSGDELVNAAFFCVPDNRVYIDGVNLVPALNEIGDYAVATEIARQYAYAAQAQRGDLDNTLASDLQADCYAGLYAASGFAGDREDQSLFLSPGDLDEAVIAFLARNQVDDIDDEPASSTDEEVVVRTAFAEFDAYRTGFMQGLGACEDLTR